MNKKYDYPVMTISISSIEFSAFENILYPNCSWLVWKSHGVVVLLDPNIMKEPICFDKDIDRLHVVINAFDCDITT